VEEPFRLSVPAETPSSLKIEAGIKEGNIAGDGYYVSATNNSSRYYGLLVSKEALKAASILHFHAESESLDLNRRMKLLKERQESNGDTTDSGDVVEHVAKRQKVGDDGKMATCIGNDSLVVQKFQYVPPANDTDPGYRILIATYINAAAAADGDDSRAQAISMACNAGGAFVGEYYYKHESIVQKLQSRKENEKLTDEGLRTSMGFQTFLHETPMPIWFPLSNLHSSQHKVLSMLQMKRNSKGNIVWDELASHDALSGQGAHVTMESRSHFRIGIIGGGIAGLACAKELIRLASGENIDVEVVLLEGRSRLGGRLLTDNETFTFSDGSSFPVDLGASWIHGIDNNPLASLAKDANIEFVTAGEDVKMLSGELRSVDSEVDDSMGKLFDALLDHAADDVWDAEDYVNEDARQQKALRWYAAGLCNRDVNLRQHDAPSHRHSSDVSIDHAVGKAVAKHKHEFVRFGEQEHSLLLWNTKNVEYALGANIADLSMKFWDSDERHAFEGDHVLLKQGYSMVVRHLEMELRRHGEKFKCEMDFHVGKVEYARKSTTKSYPNPTVGRPRRLVDLSDTCCVVSKDGERRMNFDFVVSTLPLGVLKESVDAALNFRNEERHAAVIFEPPLPFPKVDAIQNTGFGLLNKVYLQFQRPFWRTAGIFDNDSQTLFGNASGLYPHHYMFNDIGKSLGTEYEKPAVLMSLISGKEAAECEVMDDRSIVNQVISVLRRLFSEDMVDEPIAFKVSRWGADEFSRGCYTFLPPGATDQDFQILQSPINGNGDSLTLEGSETMRLFWAGEHTTALHPSMAHGALLSGLRAAEEVLSTICLKNEDTSGFEKILPMAIFRKNNPTAKLQCSLCHLFGSRVREGSLFALQKGARQVLVHNNCGENSPEVEVRDGKWKDVIKAVNRGKQITCCMCGMVGATIGCTNANCYRCFHFSCAENTGWRFERDGKVYFCDNHRNYESLDENACDRVSLEFYKSKRPNGDNVRCSFCHESEKTSRCGKMLAFSQAAHLMAVHDFCARYTNTLETLEDHTNTNDVDFRNLFEIKKRAKSCKACGRDGATVVCSDISCDSHFHFVCAEDYEHWNFVKRDSHFKCRIHQGRSKSLNALTTTSDAATETKVSLPTSAAGIFQHNLFFSGAERVNHSESGTLRAKAKGEIAVNDKAWERTKTRVAVHKSPTTSDGGEYSSDDDISDIDDLLMPLSCSISGEFVRRDVTLTRPSDEEPWPFELFVLPNYDSGTGSVQVHISQGSRCEGSREDALPFLLGLNHAKIGSGDVQHMQDIVMLLKGVTSVTLTLAM
jgi:monoamine oxidase